MSKDNTRKRIALIRNYMGNKLNYSLSDEITQRVLESKEYRNAKTILFYTSFGSEVSTNKLIQQSLNDDKITLLPRILSKEKTIKALKITNTTTQIQTGHFKIKEPIDSCPEFTKNQIDMIIVPGIAFGEHGERLGYGVGYYDRYLKNCTGKFIGLAFEQQITDKIIPKPHDILMHTIITNKRTINCDRKH